MRPDARHPDVRVHSLLRIAGVDFLADSLAADVQPPPWVAQSLRRAPWVVVRRARGRPGSIAIGVRGEGRAERYAAWLPAAAVLECLTPLELAARRGWSAHPRRRQIPALAALDEAAAGFAAHGLAERWGPVGSVGFELASGAAAATDASDLDLVVEACEPVPHATAAALLAALTRVAVRADVLLETPHGALALAEYVRACPPFLVRTAQGPVLRENPWSDAVAAA